LSRVDFFVRSAHDAEEHAAEEEENQHAKKLLLLLLSNSGGSGSDGSSSGKGSGGSSGGETGASPSPRQQTRYKHTGLKIANNHSHAMIIQEKPKNWAR
jgi:hypothetical protein